MMDQIIIKHVLPLVHTSNLCFIQITENIIHQHILSTIYIKADLLRVIRLQHPLNFPDRLHIAHAIGRLHLQLQRLLSLHCLADVRLAHQLALNRYEILLLLLLFLLAPRLGQKFLIN
jgi:hypothetical protein